MVRGGMSGTMIENPEMSEEGAFSDSIWAIE
jgi:hypothetical protein